MPQSETRRLTQRKPLPQLVFIVSLLLLSAAFLYSATSHAKSHQLIQQPPINRLFALAEQVALIEVDTMFHEEDDIETSCDYQFSGRLVDPLKGTIGSKIRFRSSRPLMEGNQYYIFLGKSDATPECKSSLSMAVMSGGQAAWPRISINIVTPFSLKRSTIVIVDGLHGSTHQRLDLHLLPSDDDGDNGFTDSGSSYWIQESELKQELFRLQQP